MSDRQETPEERRRREGIERGRDRLVDDAPEPIGVYDRPAGSRLSPVTIALIALVVIAILAILAIYVF